MIYHHHPMINNNLIPEKQIRAHYNNTTIRVYQAFNQAIADSALEHGKFQSPPFKMERMTWIKPSFLWTMYRSGWAKKDDNQCRILAIDISIEGFLWALKHSLLSHQAKHFQCQHTWQQLKQSKPVRIQWDPERDLELQPLSYRAIQIGLSGDAVERYVHDWTQHIEDVTELTMTIHQHVLKGELIKAEHLLPTERCFDISAELEQHLLS